MNDKIKLIVKVILNCDKMIFPGLPKKNTPYKRNTAPNFIKS